MSEPPRRGFLQLTPSDEEVRRSMALALLGGVLLIGFFLPVMTPETGPAMRLGTRWDCPNLTIVLEERVPWRATLLMLWPGIAGATLLLLPWAVRGESRGFVLLLLFAVPIAAVATDPQVRDMAPEFMRAAMARPEAKRVILLIGLSFLAVLLLLVSSRVRRFRPEMPAAYLMGLLGAVALFILILIPVPRIGKSFDEALQTILPVKKPKESSIRIIAPGEGEREHRRFVRIVGDPEAKVKETGKTVLIAAVYEASDARHHPVVRYLARGYLVRLICLIAAAILCVVNYRPAGRGTGHGLGRVRLLALLAFLLVAMGIAADLLGSYMGLEKVFSVIAADAPPRVSYGLKTSFPVHFVKFAAWFGGLALLLPVALIDLTIGRAPAAAEAQSPMVPPPPPPVQPWQGNAPTPPAPSE